MKQFHMLAIIGIAGLLSLSVGCQHKPTRPPATYIFRNCQTVEEVHVTERKTGEQHVELTCTCAHRSEKFDAKTNRYIVECD